MTRPKVDRDAVFEQDRIPFTRDWALCRYCWRPVHRYENWHVAHEIAYSRWPRLLAWLGRDATWNLGVAHAECNLRAGNRNMTFLQRLSLRTKIRILVFIISILTISTIILIFWR